jgi:hypothetical protein
VCTKIRNREQDVKRSITIRIDSDLVRKLKPIASREGISVSALIERELNAVVKKRTSSLMNKPMSYHEARRHALALLRKGSKGGWERPASRAELHER